MIPKRAPSHSKLAHENVARQRSIQGIQGMKSWQEPARSVPTKAPQENIKPSTTANTIDFGNSRFEVSHPFGKELEQLDEVAEEFGGAIRDAEREQDEIVMSQRKLQKFSAADYLSDLQPIFTRFFVPLMPLRVAKIPEGWI